MDLTDRYSDPTTHSTILINYFILRDDDYHFKDWENEIEAILNENKMNNVLWMYLFQTFNILTDLFSNSSLISLKAHTR